MSKKMLKRSLALGALMAFVITGQAWAADVVTLENGGTVSISDYTGMANTGNYKGVCISTDATIANSNTYSVTIKGSSDAQVIAFQADAFGDRGTDVDVVFEKDVTFYAETDLKGTGNNQVTALSLQGDANVVLNGNVNATAISTNKEGKSVYGITSCGYGEQASVTFNGGVVNINVEGVTDRETGVSNAKQSRGEVTGIRIYEGAVNASTAGTILNITVDSKGTTVGQNYKESPFQPARGAAYAYGLRVGEGTADFKGTTNIVANSVGATVYGVCGEDGADIYLADTTITATSKGGTAYGVYAEAGGTIDLADSTITATSESGNAYGICAKESADVTIIGDSNVVAKGKNTVYGLYIKDSTVNMTGNNISINTESDDVATGVLAWGSEVVLGSETTENIDIILNVGEASRLTNPSKGIWVYDNNSIMTVNGGALNIDITTDAGPAFGIYAQNPGGATEDGLPVIDIGEDTKTVVTIVDKNGDAVGHAVSAMGGSIIDIKGDTYITAENVIVTRGNSTINIGQEDKIVQLDGDIYFGYADNSGTVVDADVDIKLTNANSYLKGNIIADTEPVDKVGTVTGMKLTMTNGATWELSKASVVNDATFGEGTNLVLKGNGAQFTESDDYALNGVAGADVLKVENGAKLVIEGIKEKVTYNIAKGFESIVDENDKDIIDGEYWTIDNNLMTGEWSDANGLQVTTKAKDAGQIAEDMGVDSGTASALGSIIEAANSDSVPDTEAAQNVVKFAQEIASASPEVAAAAAEAVIKMAEAGGNSATAANIVKNVTGVTNDRLSFNCGHSAPHKGGHGVGLFEEGSGADIWAEYVHGKDKVEDMPSSAGASSYEGQYNGFVLGVDFKKVNKFQSGIAFNYGEGDTNTVGSAVRTHSDYDFWGIGYYGNIHNDDSNVIFDINYAQTDSDVTQKNLTGDIEASPETTTWTAGVKVEKLYQNENVQIVPYTGLRYMSIDADDYSTKGGSYHYKMERQDIWLLPVGVSIRQEVANDNGWTVSPRVDLSYIWAFGDTNSNMGFGHALDNKITNIGYDVMDDGSFLGLVGIEAHKGQWGYGVAYSYQKGDHSESKKWYVDVNYSF